MPKHDHDGSSTLTAKLQAMSHQSRSDSLALEGGRYGHRRKRDGGNYVLSSVDLDIAEQDVPDDLLLNSRHHGRYHRSTEPQPIHEFTFRIAVEYQPIQFPNVIVVGGKFFTGDHSVTSAKPEFHRPIFGTALLIFK